MDIYLKFVFCAPLTEVTFSQSLHDLAEFHRFVCLFHEEDLFPPLHLDWQHAHSFRSPPLEWKTETVVCPSTLYKAIYDF